MVFSIYIYIFNSKVLFGLCGVVKNEDWINYLKIDFMIKFCLEI